MEQDFIELLRQELSNSLSENDVEFILSLIRSDNHDENLFVMDNDAYRQMRERGTNLEETFCDVCERLGIKWTHNNDPVY